MRMILNLLGIGVIFLLLGAFVGGLTLGCEAIGQRRVRRACCSLLLSALSLTAFLGVVVSLGI